jgi:excisionase family DNA binding protein
VSAPTTLPAARVLRGRGGYITPTTTTVKVGGGHQLTTGAVASVVGVAARTVTKWIDSGALKGWRLPESTDRRVLAADLLAFLEARRAAVPPELLTMVRGLPELILYRCPAAVVATLADAAGDADVRRVESAWELAKLFARPHKVGVVVCGDGAARSEITAVFAELPAGWLKVHVRGEDQDAAAGADVALAGGDAAGLLAAVAGHLLGAN